MGGTMKPLLSREGFTLVEILMALTIFAIAMTTLFTAFNTVISGVEPLKSGMDDFKSARIAMDRIQTDLMSLCLTLDPAYLPPPDADRRSIQVCF
jgi:general secretion pathway protein J